MRTAVISPPHERYTYLTLHDTGAQFQPSGRICPTFKVLRMVDDQPNHEQGDQRHHKNKSSATVSYESYVVLERVKIDVGRVVQKLQNG